MGLEVVFTVLCSVGIIYHDLRLLSVCRFSTGIYTNLRKPGRYLLDLNQFPSTPFSTNPRKLRIQRISTVAVIFSFVLALGVLLLNASTVKNSKTIIVQTSDLNQCQYLYSRYS